VLGKTGSCRISSTTIGQCTLAAMSGLERNPRLLLSWPTAAMLTRLAVGRVARTMPTFLLFTMSLIRHVAVNTDRQRLVTVNHSIIQQFFALQTFIFCFHNFPKMATSISPIGYCITDADCRQVTGRPKVNT